MAPTLPVLTALAAVEANRLFGAAQADLMAASSRLVAAALGNPALMWTLPMRLRTAANQTAAAVAAKVPALVRSVLLVPDHGTNSAAAIARDLTDSLTQAAYRITRFADDAYRAAVAEAAVRQVTARLAPHAAQAHAWADLMGQGITGFTDRAGREWNLASYVEMAVRTATARAYRDSQLERMTAFGERYFTVSGTGRPCPLCAPWEGKVLTLTGGAGVATEPHGATGEPFTFEVAGTVEEATAAGLFHPNCKHTMVAFTPGVTVLKATPWTGADEDRYRATQRLRALERNVRTAKTQRVNALTPADRAAANTRIRNTQAQIRAHTDQYGLNRRPQRERPDHGFTQGDAA